MQLSKQIECESCGQVYGQTVTDELTGKVTPFVVPAGGIKLEWIDESNDLYYLVCIICRHKTKVTVKFSPKIPPSEGGDGG